MNYPQALPQGFLNQFVAGFTAFFAGWPLLLRHQHLLGLSLVPILGTLLLVLLLGVLSVWFIGLVLAQLQVPPEIQVFLQTLSFLLALLVGATVYLPVARVLLAPFGEALSRQTIVTVYGHWPYQTKLAWLRAIWEGLKLVCLQVLVVIATFFLSFSVPVLGHLVWLVVIAVLCGIDFLDIPLAARGLSLRQKLGLLWRHRALVLGFGVAAYLLLLVPVLNLISLPVGVIGASLLTERMKG